MSDNLKRILIAVIGIILECKTRDRNINAYNAINKLLDTTVEMLKYNNTEMSTDEAKKEVINLISGIAN